MYMYLSLYYHYHLLRNIKNINITSEATDNTNNNISFDLFISSFKVIWSICILSICIIHCYEHIVYRWIYFDISYNFKKLNWRRKFDLLLKRSFFFVIRDSKLNMIHIYKKSMRGSLKIYNMIFYSEMKKKFIKINWNRV